MLGGIERQTSESLPARYSRPATFFFAVGNGG